jgi:hypothetical protein
LLPVVAGEAHQPRQHGPFDKRLFVSEARLLVEVSARIDFGYLACEATDIVDGPAGAVRLVRRHF